MSVPRELRATAERFRSGPERATRAAGKLYKDAIEDRLRTDTGGDLSLSGVRGSKLGVTTRYEGGESIASVEVSASKKSAGIWSWLERGTSAHTVGRGKHMKIGDWRTGGWRVSGMRAKRTWTKPVEATRDEALKAMKDAFLDG